MYIIFKYYSYKLKVQMISMPQMVAALHSFVGIAATIVGYASFFKEDVLKNHEKIQLVETYLGVFIGAVTFTGSVVAYGKLDGKIRSQSLILCGCFRHVLNLIILILSFVLLIFFVIYTDLIYLYIMTVLALFLGWHLVMAIGGADMPVVVSMLNSYSGWATSASGFMLDNRLLIISGALIGSSGAILSYIMCRAMNRSFFSVIAGGFGIEVDTGNRILFIFIIF